MLTQELRNYIIEKTYDMMNAGCCSSDAKSAAEILLASIGTDKENNALKIYIAELEEDIMPIDVLIEWAESERCAKIFGDKQADEIVHAYKLKADGVKYCDCPACKAAQAIIAKKNEIFGY